MANIVWHFLHWPISLFHQTRLQNHFSGHMSAWQSAYFSGQEDRASMGPDSYAHGNCKYVNGTWQHTLSFTVCTNEPSNCSGIKKGTTYLKENQSRTDLGVHVYSKFKRKMLPNVSVSLEKKNQHSNLVPTLNCKWCPIHYLALQRKESASNIWISMQWLNYYREKNKSKNGSSALYSLGSE
jgi:hypothetical protein